MAWQTKARGGRYYYLSVRVPGHGPVKLYLGRGEAARRAEAIVAANRRRRDEARREAAELNVGFADADALALELGEWGRALLAAAMTRAGYRKHHGSWRKGRT